LKEQVLGFWGWRDLNFQSMGEAKLAVNYRKSTRQANQHYLATWVQAVRNRVAKAPDAREFDEAAVQKIATRLPAYTLASDGIAVCLRTLACAGVTVVRVPHLEKTYLDGAALWLDGRPVIVYTARYDRDDNFW